MSTAQAWTLLLLSGGLEAVWATALAASEGFAKPLPALVFVVASVLSVWGLSRAMRKIALGTAYAVWTGTGAALTVTWSLLTGAELFSWPKVALLVLVIVATGGLKLTEPQPTRIPDAARD